MSERPSGTITFLFTDIEGSTRLWEEQPEAMRVALARHHALLRAAIETSGGTVFRTVGDAFCAAFSTASEAVEAALVLKAEGGRRKAEGPNAERRVPPGWPNAELDDEDEDEDEPNAEGLPPSAFRLPPFRVQMALHTGTAEVRDADYSGPALDRVARLLAVAHGGQVLVSDVTHGLVQDHLPPGAALEDLGSHRLRDLLRPERVFQLRHPDLPGDFPPLRSLETLPNNLPEQVTSFIGREPEMAAVKELLGRTRLLTLTGAGGTGKTRLSLQVAADLLDRYEDGVWLVELAPLSDPALVPQAVAAVLGAREEAVRPLAETLADYLKGKRLLLILDNCEHVVAACARLSDLLLRRCAPLTILATSREMLGQTGEAVYRVPSLALPDVDELPPLERLTRYEAVRLFIDRATAVVPAFAVTHQNALAVARVCYHLDGIPLALELAAARIRSLSVEEIHARLDHRFRILTGGSRATVPRHQTLRALIDWSYDLLSGPERLLLQRLSVFAGGWTLAAAEAVCTDEGGRMKDECPEPRSLHPSSFTLHPSEDVLDLLTQLADKSLVLVEKQAGETRYRMLETVRQYAGDRLAEAGEGGTAQRRHTEFFLRLVEEAECRLHTADEIQWLQSVKREHDNLRAVLDQETADPRTCEAAVRAAAALHFFWLHQGYWAEGKERLRVALERCSRASPTARAKALLAAGVLAQWRQDYTEADALLKEGLALARELDDRPSIAEALVEMSTLAVHSEVGLDRVEGLLEEVLALGRELGNEYLIAYALDRRARVMWRGDPEGANKLLEESEALCRRAGDRRTLADVLEWRAYIAAQTGDETGAAALREEMLALSRDLDDRGKMAWSSCLLAGADLRRGDLRSAAPRLQESLAIYRRLADRRGLGMVLGMLGELAQAEGDFPGAASHCEEGVALLREVGQVNSISRALCTYGFSALRMGETAKARRLFTESLELMRQEPEHCRTDLTLAGLAAVAGAHQDFQRAAVLFGAAAALKRAPMPCHQAEWDRHLDSAREALTAEAFASTWAEGKTLTLEQAIACALEERDSPA